MNSLPQCLVTTLSTLAALNKWSKPRPNANTTDVTLCTVAFTRRTTGAISEICHVHTRLHDVLVVVVYSLTLNIIKTCIYGTHSSPIFITSLYAGQYFLLYFHPTGSAYIQDSTVHRVDF